MALVFFGQLQPCVVAMTASGCAHLRRRVIGKFGHVIRLIPMCERTSIRHQSRVGAGKFSAYH
jgi:hypothetical protein